MDTETEAKTISARLAHVEHERDLLAHGVTRLAGANAYIAMIQMPADRSPAEAYADAGQQLVRAICHLFEGVPADHGIAIHETTIALRLPVKRGVVVEALVHLAVDRDNPRHFLWQCASTIDFWQGGMRTAEAQIRCMTLPRTVGDPMMRRHHARSAPIAVRSTRP
jgi:hypothetical protein